MLVITYYWPPSGGSGVQRWLKFVKYLRHYDWEPIVYVPENPEYPVLDPSLEKDIPGDLVILKHPVREPFALYKIFTGRKEHERLGAGFLSEKKTGKWIQSISLWIRGNFFIPDARMFWIRPSARYLTGYIKSNPVDVVVTNGPPMSVHMIGLKLKKKLGLPWLADFRDPWTQVDFYRELNLMKWADLKHHRFERQVLAWADLVTVATKGMAGDFQQICKRQYHVITNGYDEDDFKSEPIGSDSSFSLAHFGSLSHRANPVILWQVLGTLIRERPDFARELKIKLVGQVDHSVIESIENEQLGAFLHRISYLEHDKMVREMQRSRVLLLLVNPDPGARLILTGKLFEYLAARRPIILIGPKDGDAAEIIEKNMAGVVIGQEDADKLKASVISYFHDPSAYTLTLKGSTIESYSRKVLTGQMAQCLDYVRNMRHI